MRIPLWQPPQLASRLCPIGDDWAARYPLVMTNIQKAIEAMSIEIVDFSIEHGGSFHSYVSLPEGIHVGPYPRFQNRLCLDRFEHELK